MQLEFELLSSNDLFQFALFSSLFEIMLKMFHLAFFYVVFS